MLSVLDIFPNIHPSIHYLAGDTIQSSGNRNIKNVFSKLNILGNSFQLKNSFTIIILPQVLVTVPFLEENLFLSKRGKS